VITKKRDRLEVLNHALRNKAMEIEGILKEMNKALKEYEMNEKETSNDLKTKTK